MDVLRLRGLEFYGRHGTELWEKQNGCRFIVDLELGADFSRAAESDRLEDTLDYRVIYSRARHVVERESHNLIERIAGRLVDEMFRTFNIDHITVRVAKTEARIGGLNQAVEIELARSRAEWESTAEESPGDGRASSLEA
jgi:7,8-dihydroneopterin aldolase/epimerase/oxygenase